MILRVNTEEMQIEMLFNGGVSEAINLMGVENSQGKYSISLSKLVRTPKPASQLKAIRVAEYGNRKIRELENGSIEVYVNGELSPVAKPELRTLASELKLGILNSNGNPYNTRQLGALVINCIEGMN